MTAVEAGSGLDETRRADAIAVAALVALWLAALAVIGVAGEFPLSDDWAYARTTSHFLETGEIERVRWTWAPIVTHVLAGAAFAQIFGFSFAVLRASSVFFGLAGVLATYALCRACRVSPARSAVAAACLAVCPVYLNLAYTFMTDVPFTAWFTLALAALAFGLRRAHAGAIVGGCVAAVTATLSRQPGLAIGAGLVVSVVATRIRNLRALAITAAGVVLVGLALTIASSLFLGSGDAGGNPALRYFLERVASNPSIPFFLASNGLTSLCYLGLFALPAIAFVEPPAGRRVRGILALSGAAGVGAVALLGRLGRPLPPGVNLIYDFGLGARTLANAELLPQAPALLWWMLLWLGASAATYLLVCLGASLWERRDELSDRPDLVLLIVTPAIYLAVLWLRFPFFDRYLSVVLPPLLALAFVLSSTRAAPGAARTLVAVTAFVALGLFSVLGTRDYLVHHRVRSVLLERLEADGVSPRRVDGGFEYAGWHNFTRDRSACLDNDRMWVFDDEFLVTYAPSRPGYDALQRIEYWRWMPPAREGVSLLHRRAATGPGEG